MDSVNQRIVLDQIEEEPAIKKVEQISTMLTLVSVALVIYRVGYIHSRMESIRSREPEE